jgi:hypothetical protein
MSCKRWSFRLVAGAYCACVASVACAQSANDAPESPIHAVARFAGVATVPPPPPDFVRDSRQGASKDYLPVFRPFDEPGSKVKSKDELNAMGQDLQQRDDDHKKLLADFPAGAAAAADDAKAAAAAKKKPAPKPTSSPN